MPLNSVAKLQIFLTWIDATMTLFLCNFLKFLIKQTESGADLITALPAQQHC
jgi:hypothetical protein